MKHSERFNKAIGALVKGYINGTLVKGNCAGCAVGNIVACGMGYSMSSGKTDSGSPDILWTADNIHPRWAKVFVTIDHVQFIHEWNFCGEAKQEIESTGYTWKELARVEKAFESNTKIHYTDYFLSTEEEIDEDQLRGLYAVVDVLCDIEGINNEEEIKEFKNQFVKA